MKAVVVLVVALVTGTAAVAAERIFTNPSPDAALKQLFPAAAGFSTLAGAPLHYTAYSADPVKNPTQTPLGYAFWTTDLVPNEHGYHGPIHVLVGMRLDGILTGVVVDYNSDPYGYFSVEPPEFSAQFVNKSIRDRFAVGADVDAVSRATLTISSAARAIRDSSRLVARALLNPEAVKK